MGDTHPQPDDRPGKRREPDDAEGRQEPSAWLVAGVFGAIGMEFVGFTIAGFYIGSQVDEAFGTEPLGVIVCLLLALLGVGWHIYRIVTRFVQD